MYAIAFDLNKNAPTHAYKDIGKFLAKRGFSHQQGSLYYGDKTVTPNGPALAVFDLARELPWLRECISDIRVLQLLDSDDLKPWVDRGSDLGKKEIPKMVMTRSANS